MIILLLLLTLKVSSTEMGDADLTASPKYKPPTHSGGGNGRKTTASNTDTIFDKSFTGNVTASPANSTAAVVSGDSSSTDYSGQSSDSQMTRTPMLSNTTSSLMSTSDNGGRTSDSVTPASTLDPSSLSNGDRKYGYNDDSSAHISKAGMSHAVQGANWQIQTDRLSMVVRRTTIKQDEVPSRLICVFEYLVAGLWGRDYACTDYVYIRFFTYANDKNQPLEFVTKQQKLRNVINLYYDHTVALWNQYSARTMDSRVRTAMTRFKGSRWHLGIWGATYIRLMVNLWHANVVQASLNRTLRGNFSGGLHFSNFSGFAIINSIIKDSRPMGRALNYSHIFRGGAGHPPGVLEPNWSLIHTAAIWPGGNALISETMVSHILREADVVGIGTSNSTDEPNIVVTLEALQAPYLAASPPNPINPVAPNTRGMLEILREFPHWKQVLNRSRLGFSVTTAINYARNSVDKIDFVKPIRDKQDVQRYSRYRFVASNRTAMLPVVDKNMTYMFDNNTHTHFWRYVNSRGDLVRFFAYDDATTLGYKVSLISHGGQGTAIKIICGAGSEKLVSGSLVKEMLTAYPDDRCVVFDDEGEDAYAASFKVKNKTYEFKAYGMLKAVVEALNETSVVTSP